MFIFGFIFNGISIFTFYKILTRRLSSSRISFGGCSVYLLMNSIISQITITPLLLHIIYLLFINFNQINMNVNLNLCRILPYIIISITRSLSSYVNQIRRCNKLREPVVS
jgi:hypothetical protein